MNTFLLLPAAHDLALEEAAEGPDAHEGDLRLVGLRVRLPLV